MKAYLTTFDHCMHMSNDLELSNLHFSDGVSRRPLMSLSGMLHHRKRVLTC